MVGQEKSIFYFNKEGKQNLDKTIELVYNRALELDIKKIIIFTSDGEGATKAALKFKDSDIKLIAATFPYKMPFIYKDEKGNKHKKYAKLSEAKLKEQINELGISLVQTVMPFQDIYIPGIRDTKLITINETLTLFSGGMRLCVQAILMATESGNLEPGEAVISFSADTAIVARATLKSLLFDNEEGMEIHEIICKPKTLTISRNRINDSKKENRKDVENVE